MTELNAYGLTAPNRALVPNFSPPWARNWPQRPKYVPGPLAEGMVRVVLDDSGCTECGGEPRFHEFNPSSDTICWPHDIFDVPVDQVARWKAAEAAHDAALDEVAALIEARQAERRQPQI